MLGATQAEHGDLRRCSQADGRSGGAEAGAHVKDGAACAVGPGVEAIRQAREVEARRQKGDRDLAPVRVSAEHHGRAPPRQLGEELWVMSECDDRLSLGSADERPPHIGAPAPLSSTPAMVIASAPRASESRSLRSMVTPRARIRATSASASPK